ncbi:hypothetical protein SKAU_G00119540 [Synaphobranchus kaupii]|uniref:Uncharacterized protein n=1 Tax=Synaphobranchus kaupii TaxID=118154 RepID=A0A9Q1J293_SYNKA|nr:hypothetical protein SKAU_G00119540 [Synaphobranchus kaupii]
MKRWRPQQRATAGCILSRGNVGISSSRLLLELAHTNKAPGAHRTSEILVSMQAVIPQDSWPRALATSVMECRREHRLPRMFPSMQHCHGAANPSTCQDGGQDEIKGAGVIGAAPPDSSRRGAHSRGRGRRRGQAGLEVGGQWRLCAEAMFSP